MAQHNSDGLFIALRNEDPHKPSAWHGTFGGRHKVVDGQTRSVRLNRNCPRPTLSRQDSGRGPGVVRARDREQYSESER